MSKTYIYALIDKGEVRYVGMSTYPPGRRGAILSRARMGRGYQSGGVIAWASECLGLDPNWKPAIKILEELPSKNEDREGWWIQKLLSEGNRLLNIATAGGRKGGTRSKHTAKTKAKMSRTHRKNWSDMSTEDRKARGLRTSEGMSNNSSTYRSGRNG